jgi:hypothetical protein
VASSYKGQNLFGSGPHRFALGTLGEVVVSDLSLGGFSSDSFAVGPRELEVVVTGRLAAASEAALWTLRDAIVAQLVSPPAGGTLIDTHGRSWSDMSFITYDEGDRTDRGRVWSMSYRAVFRRFHLSQGQRPTE